MKKMLFVICTLFSLNCLLMGATLINDNFESGTSGWTILNGSQPNKWVVGSATANGSSSSIYVSKDSGTTNSYNTDSTSYVHFYKDVVIPACCIYADLTFDFKGMGEFYSPLDIIRDGLTVRVYDTTFTPVAGQQITGNNIYYATSNWTNNTIILRDNEWSLQDEYTVRIVFSWKNNNNSGEQPPAAVDNIKINYQLKPISQYLPVNNANNTSLYQVFSWNPNNYSNPTGYKLHLGTSNPPNSIYDIGLVTNWQSPMPLTPSTNYYWRLVPYGMESHIDALPIYNFTTTSDPTINTFPYNQNFQYVTAPALPQNWNALKIATHSYSYIQTHSYDGNTNLLMSNYEPNANATMILSTPPISGLTTKRLKFDAYSYSSSCDIIIGTMSNATNSATFIPLGSPVTINNINSTYMVDLNTASQNLLAFKHGNMNQAATIILDNIIIEEVPTQPIILVSPSIFNYGTIALGDQSAPTAFNIKNDGIGTLDISDISINGINASDFIFSSSLALPQYLTQGQSYTFYVAFTPNSIGSKNAEISITGTINYSVNLYANCLDATINNFPYTENFDSLSGNLPFAWKYLNDNGDNIHWESYNNSSLAHSPTNMLILSPSFSSNDYLITPRIDLSHNTILKFWSRLMNSNGSENLSVLLSSTNSTISSFTNVILPTVQISGNSWIEYTVDLSDYRDYVYIAFLNNSNTPTNDAILLDDIYFEEVPVFNAPQNLTVIPNYENIILNWETPVLDMSSLSGYIVSRNGLEISGLINSLTYTDTLVSVHNDYTYSVKAVYVNPYGISTASNFVTTSLLIRYYSLSVNVLPENSGTIQGTGNYEAGESVDLLATPITGYHFVNWSTDRISINRNQNKQQRNILSTSPNLTYTMPALNTVLNANFELSLYNLTLAVVPQSAGSVSGTATFNYQTILDSTDFVVTPNTGWQFMGWTSDPEGQTPISFPYYCPANHIIWYAQFSKINYQVSAILNPLDSGIISGLGNYHYNDTVNLIAIPNLGYHFVNWTSDSNLNRKNNQKSARDIVSTDSLLSFTMPSNCVILTANFELNPVFNPPLNLLAIPGYAQIALNWQAPASRTNVFKSNKVDTRVLIGYKIYRNNQALDNIITNLNYIDNTVLNDVNYTYQVMAIYMNPNGQSILSNAVTSTPLIPVFNPPQNLTATPAYGRITLSWQAPQSRQAKLLNAKNKQRSLAGYNLYRNNQLLANNLSDLAFVDSTVVNNINYTYTVKAVYQNPNGESISSNSVSSTPLIPVFNPPQNLLGELSVNVINLTWNSPATRALSGYKVYRNGVQISPLLQNSNYQDYEIILNHTYSYSVIAVYTNPNGESIPSNIVEINYVPSDDEISTPSVTHLKNNYPNPFNPHTTISFSLAEVSKVAIDIYDTKGRKVKTLVNRDFNPGNYEFVWNGKDNNNKELSSGVYFYSLKTKTSSEIKKMTLMK